MTNRIIASLFIIAAAIVVFGSCVAKGQTTNSIPDLIGNSQTAGLAQQFYDATIGTTNGVFVVTAARKLTGNANRFSLDYFYSFNNNAALVLGVDNARSGGYSVSSILKGGLTLKSEIAPLKNFGLTNFLVQPYGFVLMATPISGTSNNGGIGQLAGVGLNYEHSFTKNLSMDIGGFYENATGQGQFDGNWAGILTGLHYRF